MFLRFWRFTIKSTPTSHSHGIRCSDVDNLIGIYTPHQAQFMHQIISIYDSKLTHDSQTDEHGTKSVCYGLKRM